MRTLSLSISCHLVFTFQAPYLREMLQRESLRIFRFESVVCRLYQFRVTAWSFPSSYYVSFGITIHPPSHGPIAPCAEL